MCTPGSRGVGLDRWQPIAVYVCSEIFVGTDTDMSVINVLNIYRSSARMRSHVSYASASGDWLTETTSLTSEHSCTALSQTTLDDRSVGLDSTMRSGPGPVRDPVVL